MYQNDSVAALQFPIQQSIEGVIECLPESKIYEVHNRLTSINIRRVIRAIKLVKQFLAYII